MNNGTIENWAFVLTPVGGSIVKGNIKNHPLFEDGKLIVTSKLRKFNLEEMTVETLNNTYKLGTISKEFQVYLDANGYKLEDYKKTPIQLITESG